MANTLTDLTPDLFAALDTVSHELVGLIMAVSSDLSVDGAALNQTIRSFVAPASTAFDITPGELPADNGDQTIGNKVITISKERAIPIRWNGNEELAMNSGPGFNKLFQAQVAQGMRTLVNEVESDLAGLYTEASNAFDPAGTTLFDAANYSDVANARRALVQNGSPLTDMQLVLSIASGTALRSNAQYAGANTAGQQDIIRQGILADLHGMKIRESQQIVTTAAGDVASATINADGYAVGATVLTLSAVGTGAILAGDVLTFAGDTNAYVVTSGDADVSGGGTITIAAPGLKVAMSAATKAITVNTSTEKNMIFHRDAIHLVTRTPAMPSMGDMADDVMIIQDPRSGLAFQIVVYKQQRQVKMEVALAWGFAMIKPEHCSLLID